MTNYIVGKKIARSIILSILLAAGASAMNAQTTITSAPGGGYWSDPLTWIGNVIPTAVDNVIINSTVYIDYNAACNNITVNDGNVLTNKPNWYYQ